MTSDSVFIDFSFDILQNGIYQKFCLTSHMLYCMDHWLIPHIPMEGQHEPIYHLISTPKNFFLNCKNKLHKNKKKASVYYLIQLCFFEIANDKQDTIEFYVSMSPGYKT